MVTLFKHNLYIHMHILYKGYIAERSLLSLRAIIWRGKDRAVSISDERRRVRRLESASDQGKNNSGMLAAYARPLVKSAKLNDIAPILD